MKSKPIPLLLAFEKFSSVLLEGLRRARSFRSEDYLILICTMMSACYFIFRNYHISFVNLFVPKGLHFEVEALFHQFGGLAVYAVTLAASLMVVLFLYGINTFRLKVKYQKGIDRMNLSSGLGEKAKVIQVCKIKHNRTKLLIQGNGVGKERFKEKRDGLHNSFGQKLESIDYNRNNSSLIEITLVGNLLKNKVSYSSICKSLKKDYQFSPGEAVTGPIVHSIEDLPHMLIGGSSGSGKSNAFNSIVLNLLESSKRLRLHLVDLKGGLEVSDYKDLSNVEVNASTKEALSLLQSSVVEMRRRYKHLERIGQKKIDPKRDKCDRIVIAIDECTDLLGKIDRSHPDYSICKEASALVDELARKARAAGIHLILATQRIDSSSIPTRIQENMNGRLALRAETLENSVRILGNRKAYDLPAIPGRAIWAFGSKHTEIQTPLIEVEEIQSRVSALKERSLTWQKTAKVEMEKSSHPKVTGFDLSEEGTQKGEGGVLEE